MSSESLRPETVAIRAGRPEAPGQPLNHPLVTASTFRLGGERTQAASFQHVAVARQIVREQLVPTHGDHIKGFAIG